MLLPLQNAAFDAILLQKITSECGFGTDYNPDTHFNQHMPRVFIYAKLSASKLTQAACYQGLIRGTIFDANIVFLAQVKFSMGEGSYYASNHFDRRNQIRISPPAHLFWLNNF